jgi:RNA polymerase sigma factor (sigma-70 family)
MAMTRGSTREQRQARFARRYLEQAPKLVLAMSARVAAGEDDAADVVQDMLVTLLEQIAKSKSPLRFERLSDRELRSYLVRAARNRWIDRWRRREVVQRNQEEFIRAIQQPATPETSVAESDLRVRLGEAVAALGSPYRDLLQALLEEDTTLAELARRRGIKRGTIYTQFRRGIDLLRAEWDRRTKEASDLRKAKK